MVGTKWTVSLIGQAKKTFKELPENTAKTLRLLIEDLELNGYQRNNWPNFSKLKSSIYHCHLEKGRPTYVACWRVYKKEKLIEVYYAGTHEKAPY
jgi:phage-related protein